MKNGLVGRIVKARMNPSQDVYAYRPQSSPRMGGVMYRRGNELYSGHITKLRKESHD